MRTNVWSFILYRSSLHHIFTHILIFFSTPAFSTDKKLILFFVGNVPDSFDKVFTLFHIQGCIQKFQDSTCKKKFAYLGC